MKKGKLWRYLLVAQLAVALSGTVVCAEEVTPEENEPVEVIVSEEDMEMDTEGKVETETARDEVELEQETAVGTVNVADCELTPSGSGDTYTVTGYTGAGGVVDMTTDEFKVYNITAIGEFAFENKAVTKVVLPDSVQTINKRAFSNCTNLSECNIPSNVTTIGTYAFSTTKIKDVTIPANTISIGDRAFYGCGSLQTITFAERTTDLSMGESVFRECATLNSIVFPDQISSIPNNLCDGCSALTRVILPSNCTAIADEAFRGTALSAIEIPESVTRIGKEAFCNAMLSAVEIPASINSIGDYAFKGNTTLEKVEFLNPDVTLGTGVFNYCDEVTLIAEPGKVEDYAKTDNNLIYWRPTKSIEISVLPFKTSYIYGEDLVTDGMVVTATYVSSTDPASEDISLDSCVIEGYESKKIGTQAIKVTYADVSTSFDVVVQYDLASQASVVLKNTSMTYNTAPIPVEETITNKVLSTKLVVGTDYTVEYVGEHTNVGEKTVKFIGKGNYVGTVEKTFDILPAALSSLSDLQVKASNMVYTGNECKPEVTVSYGSVVIPKSNYTVTYTDNVNPGTATITIVANNNYVGETTGTFNITKRPISDATIEFSKSAYGYTGKAVKADVTVKMDGVKLKKDTDYTVTYKNNVKIGTATVTISGKGNYNSSVKKTYEIKVLDGCIYTVDKLKYKVTSAKKKEVAFTGLKSSGIKNVTIPATIKIAGKTYKVTSIANNALKNKKITEIIVGKNVKKIGKKAFYGCKKVKKITVKSTKITSVGADAFKNINADVTIKVPASKYSKYKNLFKIQKYVKKKTAYKKL